MAMTEEELKEYSETVPFTYSQIKHIYEILPEEKKNKETLDIIMFHSRRSAQSLFDSLLDIKPLWNGTSITQSLL